MPHDETPLTPERISLLNQLFEDITDEFAPEFDGRVMPEVIMAGLRRVLKAKDLAGLPGSTNRDARYNLEQCIRYLVNAEGYYRRSRE